MMIRVHIPSVRTIASPDTGRFLYNESSPMADRPEKVNGSIVIPQYTVRGVYQIVVPVTDNNAKSLFLFLNPCELAQMNNLSNFYCDQSQE